MKKKTSVAVVVVLTVVLTAAMTIAVSGARSSSGAGSSASSDSGSSSGSSSSSSVSVDSDLTVTRVGIVPLNRNGEENGTADIRAKVATGAAATAGLPLDTVVSILRINEGSSLAEVVDIADLEGYSTLTETMAIVMQDTITGTTIDEQSLISIYVPNLLESLNNLKILCYENTTGRWEVIEPEAIEYENKTITFPMLGCGTVVVVYNNS